MVLISVCSLLEGQIVKPETTSKKRRVIILSSEQGEDENSIHYRLIEIVASEASKLSRYEVFNRQDLRSLLEEQGRIQFGLVTEFNDADVVKVGQFAGANEGMKITLNQFQEVSGSLTLDFSIKLLDITTSQTINTVDIGPLYGESLADIRPQIAIEMRRLFKLSGEVLDVTPKNVLFSGGTDVGVISGSIFQIISPDEIKEFDNEKVTVPGRSIGYVRVESSTRDASRSKIVRKWGGQIKPGYQVKEKPTNAASLNYGVIASQNNINVFYCFFINPFNNIEVKSGLASGGFVDSRDETNLYLGLPVLTTYKLIQGEKFTFGATTNLYGNVLLGKKDDAGNSVIGFQGNLALGLEASILTSASKDLVLGIEYRFGGDPNWSIPPEESEEEYKPAVWNVDLGAPTFQAQGLSIRLGFRILNIDIIDTVGM
tara:strand:+ start:6325 stop:7611 length:1287 start_codon:yes stop_codon:yes gene_type:complete